MKKKIVLSFLLSLVLCSNIVPVSAASQEIANVNGTSTTATVDSNFSVLPSDLSGIIVSIPSNLDLTYDSEDLYFKVTDKVSAKGDLAENCMLDITVNDFVTYSNADNDKYDAETTFKRIETLGNFQYWTPDELAAAKTTPDERDITIKISATDVKNEGDYSGVVNFDISIQKYWNKDTLLAQGYISERSSFNTGNSIGTYQLGRDGYCNTSRNAKIETLVSQSSEGTFEFPKYVKDTDGNNYVLNNIGNSLLSFNTYLKSINIPNSVVYIDEEAFRGCTNLINITIPNSVKYIKQGAFTGCTSLETITLPDSIEKIYGKSSSNEYGAFEYCSALKSINIPRNMTEIYNYMFSDCTSLTDIKVPSKVVRIRPYAFNNCTSLTSIEIPYSCTLISEAFTNCTLLNDIYYKGKIADAKNIIMIDASYSDYAGGLSTGSKMSDADWSTITDDTSTEYILGHATWHCTDGDFIPAES